MVARAADLDRRVIRGPSLAQALRLAITMVDLTTLEGKDTPEKVRGLCRKARYPYEGRELDPPLGPVAAVCIYPALVGEVAECLAGSGIGVASVATGFPSGQAPLDLRLAEVERAIADGATEIDMVINRGAWLSGRRCVVRDEVRETMLRCRSGRAHLKIILETGELETYDAIRHASDLVIEAASQAVASCGGEGGDRLHDGEVFIKTSTGKVAPAATLPVVLVMMHAIRDHYLDTGVRIGLKPAGGIRTALAAAPYLAAVKETLGDAWLTPRLFRFGASSLLNDLIREIVHLETGRALGRHELSEA